MDENKENISDNLIDNNIPKEEASLFADSSMGAIEDEFAGIDLDNPSILEQQASSSMFDIEQETSVQEETNELASEFEIPTEIPLGQDEEEQKIQQMLEDTAVEEAAGETLEEFLTQEPIEEKSEPIEQQPVQEVKKVETLEIEEECTSTGASEMITVRPVKFPEFEPTSPIRSIKKNLDIMQDISMHVSVELGKTKSSIREVMEMEEGSIVELDKIAGEQVEVFVNGKLVAKGEVIVIEDKFGVRITSTNLPKSIE